MKSSRQNLDEAQIGIITQGTIFSSAKAARYPNVPVAGLTITARCDFAQGKYNLLNYVPIVPLDDWLAVDGLEIMLNNEINERRLDLQRSMKAKNIATSIIDHIPLHEIANTLFPLGDDQKRINDENKKFHKKCNRYVEIVNFSEKGDRNVCLEWLKKENPGRIRDIVKRLVRNDVLGHYFLPRIHADEKLIGYVCLFREVSTIPRDLVTELSKGLSEARWRMIRNESSGGEFSFVGDDIAMPVSQVGSPVLEHILQSFSHLFGRIGVDDPLEDDIQYLQDRCARSKEEDFR